MLLNFNKRIKKWCVFGSKLCGFRPTGRLHVGHYFSVIKPGQEGATVLVANYHAPEEKDFKDSIDCLEAFDVKNIVYQKDIFDPDLFFKLLNISNFNDLKKMTQFKSSDNKTAQLVTYPVLMTHDIIGYKEVLVGEDQTQHVQYARKLIEDYNEKFGTNYSIPIAKVISGRIKDLRDSSKKMSKSSPQGCLFLDDTPDEIESKIRKAITDEEGLKNLRFLFEKFVSEEVPESNQKLKELLSEQMIKLSQKIALYRLAKMGQEMELD
ncbi:MAG: hypothetical protein EKK64_00700 [Neisseriaceae bacterium]|nr:MAG: hypothetical protein EKK64_00700 [Neisseriaceae bacterium]